MNTHLARIRADRFALLLIAIAVMGAGLVLARQVTYGPSLHSDSVHYLVTARELLAGDIFIENHRDWWPPLFPLLLAAGSFGVLDPLDAAGPVNAICFGLTVLVAGHWLRRHLRSRLLVVWGCIALALAIPVAWIAAWVMTEAPFILFMTLALSFTSAFLHKPKRSTLLWAAVFTAFAWLTRYIGVAIMITVVLTLLLQHDDLARKAKRILGYGLISSIPISLFAIRNYISVGDLTSIRRITPDYPLPEVLEQTALHIGSWVGLYKMEANFDETVRIILAIILLVSIVSIGFFLQKIRKDVDYWHLLLPFLLFISIAYTIQVSSLYSGTIRHGLAERYLVPFYVIVFLIVLTLLDGVIHGMERGFRQINLQNSGRAISFALFLALFGWVSYAAHVNQEEIRAINSSSHRWGYQAAMFADSDLIEFINQLPSDSNLLANFHTETIYFHVQELHSYGFLPNDYSRIIDLIDRKDGYYLAYSLDPNIFVKYSIDDLQEIEGLDMIAIFDDGAVFQIVNYPEGIWGTYDAIMSEMPIVRSESTIYLNERTLVYAPVDCRDSRIIPRFFLHVFPEHTDDLHSSRRQYGFGNIDFAFNKGPRYDPNRCVRSVLLPDYPIVSIRTGQYDETGEELWSAEYSFEE